MPADRLQKLLAAAGYGSRRACEDYVTAGRVRVNGKVAHLGDKADPRLDKITLDGEPLQVEQRIYVMLNKPRGAISSLEGPGVLDTVRDLIDIPERIFPVGRLDVASEGLLILTNDGDLTNKLTHPRYGHDKEYKVLVLGKADGDQLNIWRRGVVIKDDAGDSERTAPAQVRVDSQAGEGTWLTVIMREGKKHQIRRVAETLGLQVSRLIRVRMGALRLGDLKAGQWRHLTPAEVKTLQSSAHKSAPSRPRAKPRPQNRSKPPDRSKPGFKSKPKFKSSRR